MQWRGQKGTFCSRVNIFFLVPGTVRFEKASNQSRDVVPKHYGSVFVSAKLLYSFGNIRSSSTDFSGVFGNRIST